MKWFKFFGEEYLLDPKMLLLTASERSCWITLLSFASAADDGGSIRYLTEPQVMTSAGMSPLREEWKLTEGILDRFEKLKMISIDDTVGTITINNWGKRQESYVSNAERQKRYRDNKKGNDSVTTPLQQSNARREVEEEKNITANADFEIKEERLGKDGEPIPPKKQRAPKEQQKQYDELCEWMQNLTGAPMPNKGKQYKHLAIAKENGISINRLKSRAEELWSQDFYRDNGMDWGAVVSSFNRKA